MRQVGSRVKASWNYLQLSWVFLMKNKDLVLLPVINFVAVLFLLTVMILGFLSLGMFEPNKAFEWPAGIALFIVLYFVMCFVTVYLNCVMLACVMERLQGRSGKRADGMRIANSRLPAIAGWALMSMTVGLIINLLERTHSMVADIIAIIVGGAFAIGTYMGLPLLIYEKCGPLKAFSRGMKMFGKNWRQVASANAIIFLAFIVIFLGLHFLAAVIPYLSPDFSIINTGLVVLLVAFMLSFGSALNAIIRSAVFLSLHAKQNVPGFDRQVLRQGFQKRHSILNR